ncbi:hypothetical protein SISNIDRAFT_535895 [Sistotremastrum niveocremeum HHB9708]|uniref:Uncharacterized protein n=1 Tax=Sistotremastrum niveocremeum HHB9708 TaxID=1314777 RepID=A0A164N6I5_9AGAM|nr:hypothetical protein SISNIDRAFT_535895 [Sistotremastrum niveocremeum HHB9708]
MSLETQVKSQSNEVVLHSDETDASSEHVYHDAKLGWIDVREGYCKGTQNAGEDIRGLMHGAFNFWFMRSNCDLAVFADMIASIKSQWTLPEKILNDYKSPLTITFAHGWLVDLALSNGSTSASGRVYFEILEVPHAFTTGLSPLSFFSENPQNTV